MAANIYDWSIDPASNATADSGINWAEGMPPSAVNNSARQMMGRVAELLGDIGGALTAGGTANALTVTTNSGFTAYSNGLLVAFRAASDNTGAATLSVNALGAVGIRKVTTSGDTPLEAGDIQADCVHVVMYNANIGGAWQLINPAERPAPTPPVRTDYVPTGGILPFAGTEPPTGYLLCWGQNASRETFADLFAVIGTTYGAGDGSTTFTLPDLRGRVIAGKDSMGGSARANRLTNQPGGVEGDILGAGGGDEQHTLTIAQMPSHDHSGSTSTNGSHVHSYTRFISTQQSVDGPGSFNVNTGGETHNTGSAGGHNHNLNISPRGGGGAHNNVQPTIIMNYIIRT